MTLQILNDERDIVRGLNDFTRLIDTRDYASVRNVFSSDLAFEYGEGEQRGIDALVALFSKFLNQCGPTQHLLGNIVVDVNGNEAVSRAYVQARHQGAGSKSHLFYDTNGEYRDCWRREKSGWRIVCRKATWVVAQGDPSVLGL